MDYITTHLDSFTKRIAEAINGRQINAPKSKPSSKKTTWNWEVFSILTHLKVVLELEGRRVSMVLLLKVARGYTERQIGLNSTKLLKRWILVASL